MATDPEEAAGHIWVLSDVRDDGRFAVTVTFSDDIAVAMEDEQAVAYALAVLDAAHKAEYDAAILAQLMAKGGLPLRTAVDYISDNVRPYRQESSTGTKLRLVPGISQKTQKPFLDIHVGDEHVGQWGTKEAKDHARAVLDVMLVARLDNLYFQSLVECLGVAKNQAYGVVSNIEEHRQES